jgi:hypothetical protein
MLARRSRTALLRISQAVSAQSECRRPPKMILQSMILLIFLDKMNRISENNSAYAAQPPCSQLHRIRSTAKGLTQKIAVSCVLERKI